MSRSIIIITQAATPSDVLVENVGNDYIRAI